MRQTYTSQKWTEALEHWAHAQLPDQHPVLKSETFMTISMLEEALAPVQDFLVHCITHQTSKMHVVLTLHVMHLQVF